MATKRKRSGSSKSKPFSAKQYEYVSKKLRENKGSSTPIPKTVYAKFTPAQKSWVKARVSR